MDKTDIVYLLRNYERNKGNILAIMSKIEQLETIATRTTPQYENDGSQHSKYSSNSKVEKACIKIQTYNEQMEQIKILVDATENELSKLKAYQRFIVLEHYSKRKKIPVIAREQKTSVSNINKILARSIKKMTE